MHYTCCTPYFHYYYIRSTSYHQTLDPGSCGTPALQNLQCLNTLCVCRTLCNPTDYILPGSSVHEILQAKILEWLAMPPPGYLPDPGIKPASLLSPTLACGFFTSSTTWEVLPKHNASTQCLVLSKCSVNICWVSVAYSHFILSKPLYNYNQLWKFWDPIKLIKKFPGIFQNSLQTMPPLRSITLLANKSPYSQSYDFSSSHVWMWELGHKAEHRKIDDFELWC